MAVYEHPQVRQWVDESRRKMAMAFHSIGDELAPAPEGRSRDRSRDASTQEDESPEAVERRRQARQEILERGRMLEERRRSRGTSGATSPSFNDLVDKDGALRSQESFASENPTAAQTTATETQLDDTHLRHRTTEARAAAFGSTMANPFADEFCMEEMSRSISPQRVLSPPVPPKPAAYQPKRLISVESSQVQMSPPAHAHTETDTISNHPSEALVDFTPTTSAPGSPPLSSPVSSAAMDLADLQPFPAQSYEPSASSPQQSSSSEAYSSVNAWAMNQSQRLQYPPPRNDRENVSSNPQSPTDQNHTSALQTPSTPPAELERAMSEFLSLSSNASHASEVDAEDADSRMGVMSEASFVSDVEDENGDGVRTPGTWTEVGSQVSEDL